jgi:hypothetical protein
MAVEANTILQRQSAIVVVARQSAQRAVKRQIKAAGRVRLSTLSAATIARLGNEWLAAHPELLAEAALSPIVQNLQYSIRKRRSDPKRELVCRTHVQNSMLGEQQ